MLLVFQNIRRGKLRIRCLVDTAVIPEMAHVKVQAVFDQSCNIFSLCFPRVVSIPREVRIWRIQKFSPNTLWFKTPAAVPATTCNIQRSNALIPGRVFPNHSLVGLVVITPDMGSIVTVKVSEELNGHSTFLEGLDSSMNAGVHLPEKTVNGPLIVEGDNVGNSIVQFEECENLWLLNLISVSIDKQIIQSNISQPFKTLFTEMSPHISISRLPVSRIVNISEVMTGENSYMNPDSG